MLRTTHKQNWGIIVLTGKQSWRATQKAAAAVTARHGTAGERGKVDFGEQEVEERGRGDGKRAGGGRTGPAVGRKLASPTSLEFTLGSILLRFLLFP